MLLQQDTRSEAAAAGALLWLPACRIVLPTALAYHALGDCRWRNEARTLFELRISMTFEWSGAALQDQRREAMALSPSEPGHTTLYVCLTLTISFGRCGTRRISSIVEEFPDAGEVPGE
jgi:hypothetical protein